MEKYKPFLLPEGVDKGGPRYWQELKEGYQLIERYRKTLRCAERAPMYYASGYNQDGEPYDIHENLGPWDAVDEAGDVLAKSQAAVRIMKAHKFTIEQVSLQEGTLIRNAEGEFVRSKDIFVLKQEKKNS
jgi:hypothetical protein